ncbi:ComEC/Rec2 family competence protein [Paenibacillus sp. A14]|uniref:ComEC/Rec2 family competence protein n=1 Tax=Paenibacillus sp. A14 TaxID=3119820 RepID=UPI002FE16897
MERRPLAAIACCWIAGSGLLYCFGGYTFLLLWGGLTLIVPLPAALGRVPWKRVVLMWVAFSLGAAYWIYNDAGNVSHIEKRPTQPGNDLLAEEAVGSVEGTIVSAVKVDGDRADFILRLSRYSWSDKPDSSPNAGQKRSPWVNSPREKVAVQVRLSSKEEAKEASAWKRGQRIAMHGTFERPGNARNYGGFDYCNYLHNQRIHWLFKVKGASGINFLPPDNFDIPVWLGKVDGLREALGRRVQELFPGWQAGYMQGLIIGLEDELEPEKYAQFTNLGLTHILAISGSHVAINVGLIFGLLRLCRVSRETSLLIVMAFVPAYVLLTGFSPSVIRSGVMTLLGLYLLRKRLIKDGMNVLSAAALLMLVWEPYFLLNVSFQLSFAVTAGLMLYVPLLTPHLHWLPERIRGAVAITVAAQLVSFPLTIFYFNQFSLLSLAANLLIVPLVSLVALPLGTFALLLSGVWLRLGQWLAYPVRCVNALTFVAAEWLDARSGFMTFWKSPSLLWIAFFYTVTYWLLKRSLPDIRRGGPFAVASYLQDTAPLPTKPEAAHPAVPFLSNHPRDRVWKRAAFNGCLALCLLALLILGYQPDFKRGIGYIQFIDVGQGDCALITTPGGLHLLVDGGGTVSFRRPKEAWRDRRVPFEVGAKTVVPLLKKRGIHRLDAIILTHGDQDHIGGLQAVVDQFPVEALITNGSLAESATMNKLMKTALSKEIPIYAAYRGMRLTPDARTTLEFLSPSPERVSPGAGIPYVKDQNRRSVVFRLKMDGRTFMFTGDMDEAAEREVLEIKELATGKETTDVLKVAHHGSKTSTSAEWLQAIRPGASVISVGAANTYGHPNGDVLKRLTEGGSAVYRTDRMGEVQMVINKGEIFVRTKIVAPAP